MYHNTSEIYLLYKAMGMQRLVERVEYLLARLKSKSSHHVLLQLAGAFIDTAILKTRSSSNGLLSTMSIMTLLLITLLIAGATDAFHSPILTTRQSRLWSTSKDLFDAVQTDDSKNETQLVSMIEGLEATNDNLDDTEDRFEPLIGLYDVSFISKTKSMNNNPVGGKWTRKNGIAQKILKTRRTFQHILPVNTTTGPCDSRAVGEAVNVVSLEALFGLVRVTVILRGDAVPLTLEERTNTSRVVQPLSTRAVKALFDAPRVVFGRTGRFLNINIGPTSSVLLDTTYCDDNVRIGMGGTSGTRFVFARCPDDDVEANEFRALLQRRPTPKKKALAFLTLLASTSIYGAVAKGTRVLGGAVGLVSLLMGALIATSSGGIEQGDRSVEFRKQEDAAASVSS